MKTPSKTSKKAKPAAKSSKASAKQTVTNKRAAAAKQKPAVKQAPAARKKSAPAKPRPKAKAKRVPAKQQPVTALKSITLAAPVMASGEFTIGTTTERTESPKKGWFRRFFGVTRRKPRLLWIGDALVPTGFATVTHAVLNHLRHDWEVIVSGINYDGAAHHLPYQVMPAWQGGDMWGLNRFQHLCAEFDPAVVVINNDWWNVAQFARLAPAGIPVVGYMPVDGGNLDPAAMRDLNQLHAAVWYTAYGHREAVKAGFKGSRQVIPHGIDTEVFYPTDRQEARRLLGLKVPPNAFIVGNINRNQPRKRLDVTIQIFAGWIKQHRLANAYLLLHCAQNDTGWDLRRIAAFHGVADRLILTGSADIRDLQDSAKLRLIYSSLDVQMTTTLGEGWGLTTMEGMACGIPQIVPDSSALSEWAVPAVKIPCSRLLMNPEINTTGALVDHAPFVAALQSLHRSKPARNRLAAQGLALVNREAYRWENVAGRFAAILSAALRTKTAKRLVRA